MSETKNEYYVNGLPVGTSVPTNKHAAKRPYCKKHSRAMLDIGGTKKCPICMKEEPKP